MPVGDLPDISINELVKSYALRVVELERNLIKTLDAEDTMEELNNLQSRIENYDERKDGADDGRGSVLQRLSVTKKLSPSSQHTKKNLPPEKAMLFALKSLSDSIDYFGEERELFMSKLASKEKLVNDKQEEWALEKEQLMAQLEELTEKKCALEEKCERHETVMEILENRIEKFEEERDSLNEELRQDDDSQKITTTGLIDDSIEIEGEHSVLSNDESIEQDEASQGDDSQTMGTGLLDDSIEIVYAPQKSKIEMLEKLLLEIERERDALTDKCHGYEATILALEAKSESAICEEDVDAAYEEVEMLQHQMDTLQTENETLSKECQQYKTTIAALLKQDKASDFKEEELRGRLSDLELDLNKEKNLIEVQDRKMKDIINQSTAKDKLVHQLQEEVEHHLIKINAFEDAFQAMGHERSTLIAKIQDLEDLNQMLEFKCDSQRDAIITIKRENSMVTVKAENDQERLSARCASLKKQCERLENQLHERTQHALKVKNFKRGVSDPPAHISVGLETINC